MDGFELPLQPDVPAKLSYGFQFTDVSDVGAYLLQSDFVDVRFHCNPPWTPGNTPQPIEPIEPVDTASSDVRRLDSGEQKFHTGKHTPARNQRLYSVCRIPPPPQKWKSDPVYILQPVGAVFKNSHC